MTNPEPVDLERLNDQYLDGTDALFEGMIRKAWPALLAELTEARKPVEDKRVQHLIAYIRGSSAPTDFAGAVSLLERIYAAIAADQEGK